MMPEEEVNRIIHNWNSGQDVWQGDLSWVGEKYDDAFVYPPSAMVKKPGNSFRALPDYDAEQARRYIAVICERYPLQVRVLLGLPMWLRFCDAWQNTGDRRKAMRVI